MSETLTPIPEQNTGQNGDRTTLDDLLDSQDQQLAVDDPSRNERPPVSPLGDRFVNIANRIKSALERRAINKAHGEALAKDAILTRQEQDTAYDSYAENIQYTQDREDAYRENARIDAAQARQEKIDRAKDTARNAGRSALSFLAEAGTVTLGVGALVAAESAKHVKSGAESAALAGIYTKDTVVNKAKSVGDTLALGAMVGADKVAESYNDVKKFVGGAIDAGRDQMTATGETIKDFFVRQKEASLARKQARREKWDNTKRNITERGNRARWNAHALRTAGRVALLSFRDTRDALKR